MLRLFSYYKPFLLALASTAMLAGGELEPIEFGGVSSEESLHRDAADGRLDRHTLLEAAIIAGGVTDRRDITAALARLDAKWTEIRNLPAEQADRELKTRTILAGMHRLILTGKYDSRCTEPDVSLRHGDFNCVTTSVLFLHFCRLYGIEACGIAVPGHVYCRLTGGTSEDVQTTCADWFDVRHRTAAQVPGLPLAAAVGVPRELSDVRLIAKIYYNRGVNLLERNDFAGSLELLHVARRLDPDDAPTRNNLLAGYNNWALQLCDEERYSLAAAKLALGREIDAAYGPLRTNDLHVHQKWVLSLCDRGRYDLALDLLDQGFTRRPEADLFNGGRFAVYGLWIRSLLESNRLSEAIRVLDEAYARYENHSEIRVQESVAFQGAIAKMRSKGDHASASHLSQMLARRIGEDRKD